jgi:hypothetical protein
MAKIKNDGLVLDLRGSLGGLVYYTGRNGKVIRHRMHMIRVATQLQRQLRAWKFTLAKRWAHYLDDLLRKAWRNLQTAERSAASRYIGGNLVRLTAGLDIQDAAPADLGISGITIATFFPVSVGASLIFFAPSPLAPGHRLYIFARGPLHHSRIARRFDLRFLGVSPPGIASPYDVGPQLVAKFGPLQPGEWISLLVAIMRDDGGVRTPGIIITFPDGHIL